MHSVGPSDQQLLHDAVQHHQAGRLPQAVALYRRVLQLNPHHPETHYNLAHALFLQGDHRHAADSFRQAIALRPNWLEAHNALGLALQTLGQIDDALDTFRQAVAIDPESADAHNNLGYAQSLKGLQDESIASFRRALAIGPRHLHALNNLAGALRTAGNLDEAAATFRTALAIRPVAEIYANLAATLKDLGRLDESLAAYRQSIAIRPAPVPHSQMLYLMLFLPHLDARTLADEHRRWNDLYAKPLRHFIAAHPNDQNPDRPLRIGYVSSDFRDHVVGRNLLPLFRHHDRNQFDITCYYNNRVNDAITAEFRCHATAWRDIIHLSDEQVAALIREDKIDILVDLTLHMGGGRLTLFARKPAPVQATFAGYPGTTGLDTIDYRLTDPILDPSDIDAHLYTEKSIRLPHSFWCYDPLAETPEPVAPPPFQANGHITFGCLNNFCKINPDVLHLWAQVLDHVPRSRLALLAPQGSARQRLLDIMQQHAIAPDRITFHNYAPRHEYLKLFDHIDISLDTIPYNGHTTSLDSLFMGVPVITLVGNTVVGRAGLSQLQNLNLPELIAHTPQDFIRIATMLANDAPRLANLRATLRQRMQSSILMNAPQFTRDIEIAYRHMWHNAKQNR
jgi:predicted O-linked N-acetylglucosamine transferase (SPINDLY family)